MEKSIELFLEDGTPHGILTAKIVNWAADILMFPRTKIADALLRLTEHRTCVYLLVGPDPELDRTRVYVGETNNIARRLVTHNTDETKNFWERAVIISSRDLTEAHALYLESRLIKIVQAAGQISIGNRTAPDYDHLPEASIRTMNYFLSQLQLILPVLGLEFMRERPKASALPVTEAAKTSPTEVIVPRFEIHTKKHDLRASAMEIDGDFILLSGSEVQPKWIGVPYHGYHKRFLELFETQKIVVNSDNKGIVQEDIAFTSPSAAAAIVLGRSSNGRMEWKLKGSDKTYEEWQNSQLPTFD